MIRLLMAAAFAGALLGQPEDPAREAQRAQVLAASGNFEEAIRIYEALARRSPGNALLLTNLCVTEYRAGRYREAAGHAAAALDLQPDLATARLFLGASRLQLGEYAPAIEALRAVTAANPRERNARLMLGEALLKAGQPAAAVEELSSAAELLPDNARVWYLLGRAREAAGQDAAAQDAWARLMGLPPSPESALRRAEVASAEQRWREAVADWQEALRLAPERPEARLGLGEAQFRSRDYRAALDTLRPLLSVQNPEARFLYGAALVNLQQPQEAIPYLESAIEQKQDLAPARAALGQALLQTGKAEEAIQWLAGALAADTDGSVHFQLFRAYQLTHREAEARRALAEYHRFRDSRAGRP